MDTRFKTSDIDEIGPTDGLIAYYNMDSLDGTTLLDNSGNGNNATNNGATLVSGINGNALSFNGTSNYVTATPSIPSGAATLSFWCYLRTNTAGDDVPVILGIPSSGRNLMIYFRSSSTKVQCLGWGLDYQTNHDKVLNTWQHYTIVSTGTQVVVYLNGIIDTLGWQTKTCSNFTELTIGYANTASWATDCIVDEVRIYNKALNSAEISQLFKLNSKFSQLITDNYESSLNYNQIVQLSNNLEGTSPKNLVTGQILGTSSNVTQNPGYLEFNGVDSYINIGDSARLNTGGTISMWYYARSIGGGNYGRIIDKSTTVTGTGGYAVYSQTNTSIWLAMEGSAVITTPTYPSLNAWHHLAVVLTSTKKELWIDGVKVANNTNTTLPPNTAGNVYIGNRADNTDRTFDGYIKNVRIYTKDLTAEEIKYLYNKGK